MTQINARCEKRVSREIGESKPFKKTDFQMSGNSSICDILVGYNALRS